MNEFVAGMIPNSRTGFDPSRRGVGPDHLHTPILFEWSAVPTARVLVLVLCCGGTIAAAAQNAGSSVASIAVNADSTTYDSHPSAVTAADGSTWVAWHAYHASRDRIILRHISSDGTLGRRHVVSEEGSVHGPPVVVALNADSVWVVWSTEVELRWRVLARQLKGDVWQSTVTVSDIETDAILPTAASTHDGALLVAWSDHRDDGFHIRGRWLRNGDWSPAVDVSSGNDEAFRPEIAVESSDDVWLFWDRFDGSRYSVVGRRVLPTLDEIEQVSPAGQHCLSPTSLATNNGLYVAWLRKEDVIGGPGVISQRHTLHAAMRNNDAWDIVTDQNGDSTAAELTQGLVAKIQPQAVATGGYLGRRTEPMLVADGNDVWLLWERKADHRASTPVSVGDLLGRRCTNGVWNDPVTLTTGRLDYHVVHSAARDDGHFALLASDLPRDTRRVYHLSLRDLSESTPFEQDKWIGWEPVTLPIADELTERQQIRVGNDSYRLFWADMHCHSGLTADAEGEHDELTHYARTRAKLDVVVFTNNDFIYDVPLTEYEFALGNFYARAYDRPNEFLSLPGYEWTSRVPGTANARLDDPGNWTRPYQNRSYPNHRSVIFPPGRGRVVRYPEVANEISALNDAVAELGGLTLTQHDAFKLSGHGVEVAMELTSGWRNYIARVPNLFHEPLNQGARLGFVANGDSHRRAPGLSGALTGIYAKELTSEAIFEALRNRRCFATNGSRFLIDARANGAFMGQDVDASDVSVTLTLRAIGTRPIVSAVLIRDGEEIRSVSGAGTRELVTRIEDTGLSPGLHWYYWRVAQTRDAPVLPGNLMAAQGHLAWSTPHWVTVK